MRRQPIDPVVIGIAEAIADLVAAIPGSMLGAYVFCYVIEETWHAYWPLVTFLVLDSASMVWWKDYRHSKYIKSLTEPKNGNT